MTIKKWTSHQIPDLTGKIAIVTGANSGLGYESTLALARQGAHVIMACRNTDKGESAAVKVTEQVPNAKLTVMALDLASLDSVRAFAAAFQAAHDRLDILLNNAGVMGISRQETEDGFEMQFGVNHLAHFALTGLLLETLLATPGSRVVTVTSTAHMMGQINFEDLQLKEDYSRYGSYGQSKLANVLFGFELQRRLEAMGADTISLVAHPGYAATNLQSNSMSGSGALLDRLIYPVTNRLFAQSQEKGAWSQLYAATAPDVNGGEFYAPAFLQQRGHPKQVQGSKKGHDEAVAARLWEVSEELTGVSYAVAEPVA